MLFERKSQEKNGVKVEDIKFKKNKQVQAALVIRGLGIRGFDYSRVGKHGKTANSKGILWYLSLI